MYRMFTVNSSNESSRLTLTFKIYTIFTNKKKATNHKNKNKKLDTPKFEKLYISETLIEKIFSKAGS